MTVHVAKAAEAANATEQAKVEELRSRLGQKMTTGIPKDLDTDLNLLRWIRGYQGDMERIAENFISYANSREAAGFVVDKLPEKFFEMDHIAPFLPYIASSRLYDTQWSEEHNAFLFVERAWGQPKEFIKTFKTSDYLVHCFGYSEMLLQLILERERRQPAGKGPVQFIVIFDLQSVNITDYVNPLSGYMKLWQLRSDLWQDWFPEMVQRIFLVNPPRLVSVLWKVARLFLSEQNLKKIEIIGGKDEMPRHLPKWFVPQEFGGDFVAKIENGDDSGVSHRRKIMAADHYQVYQHYKKKGVERPKANKKDVSPGEIFAVPITVSEGRSLLWDFTVSGEVEFSIYKDKDPQTLVYPRLRLVTNKLNEEGVLDNLGDGEYTLCFHNKSGYFTVKVEYSILVV